MSGAQPESLEAELLALQAALANLRTCVRAGDAASIGSAAAALAQLADAAQADNLVMQHALEKLGAHTFTEAAKRLRARGDLDQASRLLRLRALLAAIVRQRAELETFVQECLEALDATRQRTAQRQPRGRLLGSA